MQLICVLTKYDNYELCFDLSIYLNGENPSFEFYVNCVTLLSLKKTLLISISFPQATENIQIAMLE